MAGMVSGEFVAGYFQKVKEHFHILCFRWHALTCEDLNWSWGINWYQEVRRERRESYGLGSADVSVG